MKTVFIIAWGRPEQEKLAQGTCESLSRFSLKRLLADTGPEGISAGIRPVVALERADFEN